MALAGIPPLTGVSLASTTGAAEPLDTVMSMTTCAVLSCSETASAEIENEKSGSEFLVCPDHKTAVENGHPWWPDRDSHTGILMGRDMPAPGLAKWSVLETEAPGLILTIETDRPDVEPFKIYLSKDSYENLAGAFRPVFKPAAQ